ncbi:MAG: MCP four helix bundle domain-containing protein [Burkholderiaceae bacterium]|nr:MCP four helix bundle domain-containing protein [Burkholderiaceae bacterium]
MSRDLKVSTRLALAFGALVLLTALVAATALFKLAGIEANMASLVEQRLPRIARLNEVKFRLNQIGLAMRDTALMSQAADIQARQQQIVAERDAIGRLLDQLKTEINTDQGQTLLARIFEARTRYVPAQLRFLELVGSGKADEARAYLLGTARPLQLSYFAAVDELIAFQGTLVKTASDQASAAAHSAKLWVASLSAAAVLLALAAAVWIVRSLTRQLGAEPGDAAALANAVAEGDLTGQVRLRPGDTTSLMAQLLAMQTRLSQVVAKVRSNSESVATASHQIAHGNQDLSQRTEEQASALQQTAATMEQLGTTVRHNADSARQADQLARTASRVAVQGGEVVGQVVSTMQGISDSSRRIGDIIGVIDGIAFQTNILALNAAVEAARAGEQGRGFAVVASEVRSLAQRSAAAAKEIKSLIERSVGQVEQGTRLVDQAGRTMGEIVGSIQRVSSIVAEISSASVEQSAGIQQVGDAVGQMDQVTQQNAALVEESAAAAESLNGQARQLVQAVSVFRLRG